MWSGKPPGGRPRFCFIGCRPLMKWQCGRRACQCFICACAQGRGAGGMFCSTRCRAAGLCVQWLLKRTPGGRICVTRCVERRTMSQCLLSCIWLVYALRKRRMRVGGRHRTSAVPHSLCAIFIFRLFVFSGHSFSTSDISTSDTNNNHLHR